MIAPPVAARGGRLGDDGVGLVVFAAQPPIRSRHLNDGRSALEEMASQFGSMAPLPSSPTRSTNCS